MGMNDYEIIAPPKSAVEDRPELPHLSKCIKSLKDGCYAVVRYAYLKEWKYYVIETRQFKLSVYAQKHPELWEFLEGLRLKGTCFWICVRGLEYFIISQSRKISWGSVGSDKSEQQCLEGELEDMPFSSHDRETIAVVLF